jgi:hypothetical protein
MKEGGRSDCRLRRICKDHTKPIAILNAARPVLRATGICQQKRSSLSWVSYSSILHQMPANQDSDQFVASSISIDRWDFEHA